MQWLFMQHVSDICHFMSLYLDIKICQIDQESTMLHWNLSLSGRSFKKTIVATHIAHSKFYNKTATVSANHKLSFIAEKCEILHDYLHSIPTHCCMDLTSISKQESSM